MIAAATAFCGPWCLSSMACCAMSMCAKACCSLTSCFTCGSHTSTRTHARLAKLLYLLIFLASAVLGIILRYYGEQALSQWVQTMKLCTNGECWGVQADYRISAALTGFFFILTIFVAVAPIAHYGAWLLKLLGFIALLGISLAIPNSFFNVYAEISRYLSILFLIVQVIILVDFAYTVHEWLLKKMDEKDAEFDANGWEPGIFSNCWKVLYVFVAFSLVAGSIAAIGVMYHFFGKCSLMQFFLSETLAIGLVCIVASLPAGKGLLPPCILFAYNTYLVYGAITNNPDAACNSMARAENENQGSIIAGLVIAALSITWAAYASAGGMATMISSGKQQSNAPAALPTIVTTPDIESGAAKTQDWAPAKGAAKADGAASAYADDDAKERASSSPRSAAALTAQPADEENEDVPPRIWIFHLIMALAGLYMAMLLTNWGEERKTGNAEGNPELSTASMWVRMVTQWMIHLLYGWTLIAPLVCTSRDFS